jgi:hypothetical protein
MQRRRVMLMRERVAEWLDGKIDVTNVRPVQVRFHSWKWHGAAFIQGGEEVYYLVGNRLKHNDPTCYRLAPFDGTDTKLEEPIDWYIGGYIEWEDDQPDADWGAHPFGNHWLLVPWTIEGVHDSRIDEYADEPYDRVTFTVKEYPR